MLTSAEKICAMPVELNPPFLGAQKTSEDVDFADALKGCLKDEKAAIVRDLLSECSSARRAMLSALEVDRCPASRWSLCLCRPVRLVLARFTRVVSLALRPCVDRCASLSSQWASFCEPRADASMAKQQAGVAVEAVRKYLSVLQGFRSASVPVAPTDKDKGKDADKAKEDKAKEDKATKEDGKEGDSADKTKQPQADDEKGEGTADDSAAKSSTPPAAGGFCCAQAADDSAIAKDTSTLRGLVAFVWRDVLSAAGDAFSSADSVVRG